MSPSTPIQAQLDRIRQADARGSKRHWLVLGAGMAGLAAAYLLDRLGHRVTLFEADSRVGGRVRTHRFGSDPAACGELGAARVPPEHDYTRFFIREMDLALTPYSCPGQCANLFLHNRAVVLRILDPTRWEPSPRTSAILPGYLLERLGYRPHCTEIERALSGYSFSARLQRDMDALIKGFLARGGIRFHAGRPAAFPSELRAWWYDQTLAYFRARSVTWDRSSQTIDGGMDLLPRALALRLGDNLKLGSQVLGLRNGSGQPWVCVRDGGGNHEWVSGDGVLCTIPYSVLRTLSLEGFSHGKTRAIHGLRSTTATKAFLYLDRPWPAPPRSPHEWMASRSARSVGSEVGAPSERARALLADYAIGEDAVRIGSLGQERALDIIQKNVRALDRNHGAAVLERVFQDWEREPWIRASFSFLWKDQLKGIYRDTLAPEGRFFFAGEHCADRPGWIQSALTSALATVETMLASG